MSTKFTTGHGIPCGRCGYDHAWHDPAVLFVELHFSKHNGFGLSLHECILKGGYYPEDPKAWRKLYVHWQKWDKRR